MVIKTVPALCGSIAGQPSPFGVKMHNAAYDALGLDYRYVSMGAEDVALAVSTMRILSVRGFAISMPHKQTVMPLLDELTQEVRAIGACNTVVNEAGILLGHNTDWLGALAALDEVDIRGLRSALVVGAGGAARAIAYGLHHRSIEVYIAARSATAAERLVDDLHLHGAMTLDRQGDMHADIVVNATPVATWPDGGPVNLSRHRNAEVLLDVVAFKHRRTELVAAAQEQGLRVATGWRMRLHQAAKQFELFTGMPAPIHCMAAALEQALPA